MMLIGLPSTLPPKSSTAICAAVTEPWPVGVEAGPFMSVRTPILTTSSEIWASAVWDDKAAAMNAASTDSFLAEIKTVLPLSFGASAVWLDRELELGRQHVLAIILPPASTSRNSPKAAGRNRGPPISPRRGSRCRNPPCRRGWQRQDRDPSDMGDRDAANPWVRRRRASATRRATSAHQRRAA